MSTFKAYDIRGTYPDQIDEAIARRIGAAFAKFLGAKTLVVGRDMRTMAPSVQDAVIEGILDQGSDQELAGGEVAVQGGASQARGLGNDRE